MRLLRLARNPSPWLRVALASLVLAFALNSIASVTHRHEATIGHQLHSALCGYCISFDHMSPAPATRASTITPAIAVEVAVRTTTVVASRFALTSAQPRAPPIA